ncbi:major facilitator superfamily domain-containing protein, partial [Jimgerdemannia flammicorona]
GRLSDIFGRQSTLLFATITFFIGSAACGAAPGIWSLVVARAVAGIGGGGLNTMCTVVMSDLVSLRQRGKFQGLGNLAFASASLIGAPLGGYITDNFSWRYCFYINLPLLLVCFLITTTQITNYNLQMDFTDTYPLFNKLKRIDYFGSGSLVLGVTGLLLGTAWGGNTMPWTSPIVVACIVDGVVMLFVFGFVEARVAKEPILPWHVFWARTPLAVSMTNLFSSMNSYAMIFFVPLYFQAVYGSSASQAGLNLVPKVIGAAIGSLSAGLLMARRGTYQFLTWFVFLLIIAGSFGLKDWALERGPTWQYAAPLFFVGYGFGSGLTTTLVALLASVDVEDIAVAASMSYLFRATGGVMGVSICSAVFQALLKSELIANIHGPDADLVGFTFTSSFYSFKLGISDFMHGTLITPSLSFPKIIDTARKSVDAIRTLPAEYKDIVIAAYFHGIQCTFSVVIVFAVLAFVSSLFIQKVKLSNRVPVDRS